MNNNLAAAFLRGFIKIRCKSEKIKYWRDEKFIESTAIFEIWQPSYLFLAAPESRWKISI